MKLAVLPFVIISLSCTLGETQMSAPKFLAKAEISNVAMFESSTPVVVTDSGPVQGEALATTFAYRGIPYAAPHTRERRWRPPAPPTPWRTTRDATRVAPICPQITTPRGGFVLNPFQSQVAAGDEDCLALNIWVPRASGEQQFPVMVFIHGGGHVRGASSHYDGAALAERGVVLVAVNYR